MATVGDYGRLLTRALRALWWPVVAGGLIGLYAVFTWVYCGWATHP